MRRRWCSPRPSRSSSSTRRTSRGLRRRRRRPRRRRHSPISRSRACSRRRSSAAGARAGSRSGGPLLLLPRAAFVVCGALARDALAPRRGLRARATRRQRREVRVVRGAAAGDAILLVRTTRGSRAAPPRARRLERRCDRLGSAAVPRRSCRSSRASGRASASRPSSGSTTSRRCRARRSSSARPAIALGDGRPRGRRWSFVALATGTLGVVLSGAMTAVGRALARAGGGVARREGGGARCGATRAVALVAVSWSSQPGRLRCARETIERVCRVPRHPRPGGARPASRATRTGRCSPTSAGGSGSTARSRASVGRPRARSGRTAPFLADAHARFPDEPEQAFPSPEHPWGVQNSVSPGRGRSRHRRHRPPRSASPPRRSRRRPQPARTPGALVGLGWLAVAAGVWAGIGLVAGLPLEALTWLGVGLGPVTVP